MSSSFLSIMENIVAGKLQTRVPGGKFVLAVAAGRIRAGKATVV
jgi:hypothetical protein